MNTPTNRPSDWRDTTIIQEKCPQCGAWIRGTDNALDILLRLHMNRCDGKPFPRFRRLIRELFHRIIGASL